jgi:hypothetical protein
MPGPEPPIPLISPFDPNDYTAVEAGSSIGTVRQISDGSTDVNLGVTFNDNNTIKNQPLLPYEGDIIYEGRFGNSIRLGATVKNANLANTWSTEGTNGDPITIIRNGQGQPVDSDPFATTIEDINKDDSSIYLTSNQKIVLEDVVNFPFRSYGKGITKQSQVILEIEQAPTSNDILSAQQQDSTAIRNT